MDKVDRTNEGNTCGAMATNDRVDQIIDWLTAHDCGKCAGEPIIADISRRNDKLEQWVRVHDKYTKDFEDAFADHDNWMANHNERKAGARAILTVPKLYNVALSKDEVKALYRESLEDHVTVFHSYPLVSPDSEVAAEKSTEHRISSLAQLRAEWDAPTIEQELEAGLAEHIECGNKPCTRIYLPMAKWQDYRKSLMGPSANCGISDTVLMFRSIPMYGYTGDSNDKIKYCID